MHRPFIIIALVNLLCVAALGIALSLLPHVDPQPVSEIRSRLQSAPTFEELQRRASAAGSAIEAADHAMVHLHQVAVHSEIFGIALAVLNTALVWLLFRQPTLKV